MPTTHKITIYSTNASPLPLTISDDEGHTASTHDDDANLTTEFRVGDTVRFEISTEPGCEIANIESINVNDLIDENGQPYNLFTSGPQSAEDGTGSWVGVMGRTGVGSEDHYTSPAESYTITFLMNDGTSHTEDPRLKIRQ